jgi:hypothetical protein
MAVSLVVRRKKISLKNGIETLDHDRKSLKKKPAFKALASKKSELTRKQRLTIARSAVINALYRLVKI